MNKSILERFNFFFARVWDTLEYIGKDGSWNSMISAHINWQIFANIGMCLYCTMGEEVYFLIVNPFQPKSCIKKWANNPRYRDPSFPNGVARYSSHNLVMLYCIKQSIKAGGLIASHVWSSDDYCMQMV